MVVEEFRIGNLIEMQKVDGTWEMMKIVSIPNALTSDIVVSKLNAVDGDLEMGIKLNLKSGKETQQIRPIHISEDNLLMCGFDNSEPESWQLDGFDFYTVSIGEKIPRHLNYNGHKIWQSYLHNSQNRFYLHEFQNLFFVIRGKELIIKTN